MRKTILFLAIFVAILSACSGDAPNVPKPKGYFRINFPEHTYQSFNADAPFSFQYPTYATLTKDTDRNSQPYWYNLKFPQFNGQLHVTYHGVFSAKNYANMTELTRMLAMKHTIKANSIDQKLINYPDKKVYGLYYAIEGNTASSVQFFLTDSSKHYLRGALYFNERPQYDSIKPVIKFIKKDIDQLIESFKWKN